MTTTTPLTAALSSLRNTRDAFAAAGRAAGEARQASNPAPVATPAETYPTLATAARKLHEDSYTLIGMVNGVATILEEVDTLTSAARALSTPDLRNVCNALDIPGALDVGRPTLLRRFSLYCTEVLRAYESIQV